MGVVHHPRMRQLLLPLLLFSLAVCEGRDVGESCLRDTVETFTENETIVLRAEGDTTGWGCSFEINISGEECCYVEEKREERRGEKLCKESEQPKVCRQSRSGKYKVEEDGQGCTLTLPEARTNDTGVYRVKFPMDKVNPERRIQVYVQKAVQESFIAFGVTLAVLIPLIIFTLYHHIVTPFQEKRRKDQRIKDEEVFKKLKNEDEEGYKNALNGRHILELQDSELNNIYHLASAASWSDKMTSIVLRNQPDVNLEAHNADEEAPIEKELLPSKSIFSDLKPLDNSTLRECLRSCVWPFKLPVLNQDLNSSNIDGDTPLMIAAGAGQSVKVEALLQHETVNIDATNNKGDTALQKALLGYITSEEKKGKYCDIIQKIKGQEGTDLVASLLAEESLDIARLLAEEKHKEGKREFALFQIAVKLGKRDIVDFLRSHDNSWKETENEALKTVYLAAAAGHQEIFETLINDANLNRENYIRDCLLRAVRDISAVENICKLQGTDIQYPSIVGWLLRAVTENDLCTVERICQLDSKNFPVSKDDRSTAS